MSDTAPAEGTETTDIDAGEDARTGDDPAAEVERLRGELAKARKWEDRAKANAAAAKELEALKQSSMSDMEKAVEQARIDGLNEGISKAGTKLVRAEMKAAAAGRLDATQLDTLLEPLNLAAFLDDDGEVDTDKVSAYIAGIAPAEQTDDTQQPQSFPDLGQGSRGTTPLGSDPLLGMLKGSLGIK